MEDARKTGMGDQLETELFFTGGDGARPLPSYWNIVILSTIQRLLFDEICDHEESVQESNKRPQI